jgi:hypothetical protein
MNRFLPAFRFVAIAVCVVASSQAIAGPACVTGSMASYVALGPDGCTDGSLTYSDFAYSGSTPATVAGIELLGGGNGLRFSNGMDGWTGFQISFHVVADPPIVGEALRLNGGASPGLPGFDGGPQNQSVIATLTPGGTLVTFAEASLSSGCYDHLSACYPIISAQFEDSRSVVPTAQQDVVLDGFASSLFRAPILSVEVAFNTPEPGTISLLVIGIIGIGLLGRRRRRAARLRS